MDETTQGPETPQGGFKGKGIAVQGDAIAFKPRNWEELWNFATLIAKTSFVPKAFEQNPGAVLAAIQTGHEIGLPPMASLQSICVINGRPSVWGDGALAVLEASPKFEWIKEIPPHETVQAGAGECTIKMRGQEPVTRRFTKDMADRAGLLKKEGTWQTYTGRMYQMRARAWAIRDAAPGVLKGVGIAEEVRDIETEAIPETEKPIGLPQPLKESKVDSGQIPQKATDANAEGTRVKPIEDNTQRSAIETGQEKPKRSVGRPRKETTPPVQPTTETACEPRVEGARHPLGGTPKDEPKPLAERIKDETVPLKERVLDWIDCCPDDDIKSTPNFCSASVLKLQTENDQLAVLRPYNERRRRLFG